MDSITLNGIFSIFVFFFSLIAVVILFGIVNRTKAEVKLGFLFILMGMFSFVLFGAFKILEAYQITGQIFLDEIFGIAFVLLIVAGVWKLRSLIRELSEFGQAFILTTKKKFEEKLPSLVKDVKGVCYVCLENPYKEISSYLDLYNIDTSSMHFIDASGGKCDAENCTSVNNNPNDIKTTLDRVLKEKNIRCVVIDNVSALKDIKKFEIPLFVQDTSLLIKSNEAQGFFIGKIENLDKETINDISMIVDKVMGESEW